MSRKFKGILRVAATPTLKVLQNDFAKKPILTGSYGSVNLRFGNEFDDDKTIIKLNGIARQLVTDSGLMFSAHVPVADQIQILGHELSAEGSVTLPNSLSSDILDTDLYLEIEVFSEVKYVIAGE